MSQPCTADVNTLLFKSLESINHYHRQIEEQHDSVISINKKHIDDLKNLASHLENMLTHTECELEKSIKENSVIHLKPKTLHAIDIAIGQLLHDGKTDDKIRAVHRILFETDIPFLPLLTSVQTLVQSAKLKLDDTAAFHTVANSIPENETPEKGKSHEALYSSHFKQGTP